MAVPAPTTRRDFLRGRPIAEVVNDLNSDTTDVARSAIGTATRPGATSTSLVSVRRRAMACQFEIILPADTPMATEAAIDALDEIDRLEDQMTVYRDTSEISRINLLASLTPVPVEERLFELFETALRLSDETNGAFDMAAGALVKAWGFFRGPKRVPPPHELAQVLERVGSRHVVLDWQRRTIEFRRPGVELNLGAIGKGYALDRATERLQRDWNVTSGILHGGQSSVLAIGSPGGEKGVGSLLCEAPSGPSRQKTPDSFLSDGWLVAIAHPTRSNEQVAQVLLRDAALGTSGATIQYFESNGRRFGHILDPRTGWPAATEKGTGPICAKHPPGRSGKLDLSPFPPLDGHACVSVIAPTAAQADALSTAFFILGIDAARHYCDQRPEIGAIVVACPCENEMVEVNLFGCAKHLVQLTASQNSQPSTLNPQP